MIGLGPTIGLITEVLGCEVTWKGKEVKVRHPRRGDLKVTQVNGCPQIPRQEALIVEGMNGGESSSPNCGKWFTKKYGQTANRRLRSW